MWINNGKIEKQIKDENIPEGFTKGRLKKIKKIDILIQKISKQDLFDYYIVKNNSYLDTMNYFNLEIRADLRQLLSYYKIAKDHKKSAKYAKRIKKTNEEYKLIGLKSAETQRNNWLNKTDIEKKAYSDKQKLAHSTESFKKTISQINKDYRKNLDKDIEIAKNRQRSESCKKAWNNKDLIKKRNETAKLNRLNREKSLCRTIIEQNIYNELYKYFKDIQYDIFVDNRYPFYCDFYIKSLDLFIEIQGHPSHGKIPFYANNLESLNIAYKLYGSWRDIYIHKDPEKLKIAIQNNLNLIRIYPNVSLEKNIEINNNQNINIIKIIINSIK